MVNNPRLIQALVADARLRRRRRVGTLVDDVSIRSRRMVPVLLVVAVLTVNMEATARNRHQDHDSQERGPDDARYTWHNVSLPLFSRAPE